MFYFILLYQPLIIGNLLYYKKSIANTKLTALYIAIKTYSFITINILYINNNKGYYK